MSLYIVSNRFPATLKKEDEDFSVIKSSGGLVSGISSYLASMNSSSLDRSNYNWIGWPGLSVPDEKQEDVKGLLGEQKLIPVFLDEQTMDKFYLGFCNKTIWPLFHYFPSFTTYDNEMWNIYKSVNEKFCDIICKYATSDDTIWIHDYHLMLLPELVRKKINNAKIGFFLHIPFPHYEIFRLLPPKWCEEIIKGMMGADLVGFHTSDYTRYFLGNVMRLLGYDNDIGELHYEDRIIKVNTFPMGIDFKSFNDLSNSEKVISEGNELKENNQNQKIILSIDRLDYTKGILNRLQGFQLFLKDNPDWIEKVIMYAVTVPSRVGVETYDQMKKEIDETIGNINGMYSTVNWTPIIYQFKSIDDDLLSALYRISDVALITPLRDGMNLIAKEYIASKTGEPGVLILSEMAGAAKEMMETLIINPNHIENIADAIKRALEMDVSKQKEILNILREKLKNNDVIKWANDFLIALYNIKSKQKSYEKKYLDDKIKNNIINDFKKARKKIVFLDYDGTLIDFYNDPRDAKPDSELIELLSDFTANQNAHLVIISGRDYQTMEEWFWEVNASLVAEHGVWIKKKNKKWKIVKDIDSSWKRNIIPFLQQYSERLAGSFYEEKSHSLVWHYRKADKIHGDMVANELAHSLISITANMNVQVLRGKRIIEIRNTGINKGTAIKDFHPEDNYNFIMAIGDDFTDEDMFRVLPYNAYSVKVGMSDSNAKFNLYNQTEVRNLIKDLIYAK